jgi:hypothetical protein
MDYTAFGRLVMASAMATASAVSVSGRAWAGDTPISPTVPVVACDNHGLMIGGSCVRISGHVRTEYSFVKGPDVPRSNGVVAIGMPATHHGERLGFHTQGVADVDARSDNGVRAYLRVKSDFH